MFLLGIDNATPISPESAKAAQAQVVCAYIGGINNGGRSWQPQHVAALLKSGYKILPIYVGQNVGYAVDGLNTQGGHTDGNDALQCLARFGIPKGNCVALDIEYGTYENRPADTKAYADAWAEMVHANGYLPVAYNTVNMCRNWTPKVPCGVWVADWVNVRPQNTDGLNIPADRFHGVGWQYTDAYNIGGHYDGSIFPSLWWDGGSGASGEDWEIPMDTSGQVTEDGHIRYFKETGHGIGGGFRSFWEKYGGLATFGYPISEEFTDASGKTVQYFERARFEFRPGSNSARFDVELGLLGSEMITANNQNKVYAAAFAKRTFR